jgi:hypothetical protein
VPDDRDAGMATAGEALGGPPMSHHDQMDTAKTDHGKMTRGAEDVASQESEPGRHDLGRHETGRERGGSTMRDVTSVNPKEPITTDGRSKG